MSAIMIIQILLWILAKFTVIQTASDDILITIFAITNNQTSLNKIAGVQSTGGHYLAIKQLNSNFPYNMELKVLNADMDPQKALKKALDVTEYKSTSNHIYFPLVIGAPWSTLSTQISPILGLKNMGSISATSSSIVLSNTNKYPYFYRTIPTDKLQSHGVMELCDRFKWNKIAVIYVDDAYGSYLSLELQQLSTRYNIDVTSIAIKNEDEKTYDHAVDQIRKLQIYVIVVVTHSDYKLFDTFKKKGILRYPYYYLGTDGWFDVATINKWQNRWTKATVHELEGFIGTIPWQPDSLSVDQYQTKDLRDMVTQSMSKADEIARLWELERNSNNTDNLFADQPLSSTPYTYDNMYVIAKAITEIDNNYEIYNGTLLDLALREPDNLINIINEIILGMEFVGASGNISFDENGDRRQGLYSIGITLYDGSIQYIGYFHHDDHGNLTLEINDDNIIWPKYFTDLDVIPRLDKVFHGQIITIKTPVFFIIFGFLCVSCLIAFVCMILLCIFHKNSIIKHVSWRLNVIMSFGAMLFYGSGVLYGIDESKIFNLYAEDEKDRTELTVFCNLRLWMISISFTLLTMPLFLKTYRLSHIFKEVLEKIVLTDRRLFIYTIISVIIDIILLTLFTILVGLRRNYSIWDKWEWIGSCSFINYHGDWEWIEGNNLNWLFYGSIGIWKVCEFIFGIYVGLNVSRIKDITNLLRRYDETGWQLLSILFTFFIICITVTISIFGDNEPSFNYIVISITILLIGNIILFFNLFQRIFAVITGNEDKIIDPQKSMRDRIKKELQRYRSSVSSPNNVSSALSSGLEIQIINNNNNQNKTNNNHEIAISDQHENNNEYNGFISNSEQN